MGLAVGRNQHEKFKIGGGWSASKVDVDALQFVPFYSQLESECIDNWVLADRSASYVSLR